VKGCNHGRIYKNMGSSMLTVLAEGKTLEEARCITDDDVVNALGGIPENKKHCSLLGVIALQKAIAHYKKNWRRPEQV
jgi:nitrogen fixation NifU-like protein